MLETIDQVIIWSEMTDLRARKAKRHSVETAELSTTSMSYLTVHSFSMRTHAPKASRKM